MNIWRTVRRSREETVWNALDPTMQGMVNQGGVLRGIEGVDTPPRIALFPYVSAYSTTAVTTKVNVNGRRPSMVVLTPKSASAMPSPWT